MTAVSVDGDRRCKRLCKPDVTLSQPLRKVRFLLLIFRSCQWVPALGAEGDFVSVACNHCATEGWLGDMADEFHSGKLFNLLVIVERYGEEELIVLASFAMIQPSL